MKAIILAAGVGRRLADLSGGNPKCLLRIEDQSLLERMIRSLLHSRVSPIVLVVGFRHETIRHEIRRLFPAEDVRFVLNDHFRFGSLLSLWSARDHLNQDTLLMDADVLFHPEILDRLITSRHANAFLIDRSYDDDGEGMIVAGRDNRVVGFDRGLHRPGHLLGESVGFFKLTPHTGTALTRAMGSFIDRQQLDTHYESAIASLLGEHVFGYEDITGLPWAEIDFPEDAERAKTDVLPRLASPFPVRRWVLLNPGPANTTDAVRRVPSQLPDLCHRETDFYQVMQEVRRELVEVAGASPATHSCVLFTGSGTAAVEAMIASAVPEDGKILVVDNGVYGDRMVHIAEAHRIPVHRIKLPWTQPADPKDVEAALADPAITHVGVIHHETTTGMLNPVHDIGEVVSRHGRALIVDAMSSFAGEPLDAVKDHIDFLASSANKCLQGLPGISFAIARRDRLEALRGRPPRSIYLDLFNQWVQEEADNTPFTPAVQVLFSLRQALKELAEETLPTRIDRYAACARTLRDGMAALGFRILLPETCRSNLLTAFLLPEGLSYQALHDAMKMRGFIIYAGQSNLKDYAFRIANLGTLRPRDMESVVYSVRDCLHELGIRPTTPGNGLR